MSAHSSDSPERSPPPPTDAAGDAHAPEPADAQADQQIVEYTQGTQFAWVATALLGQREEILTRWLAAVAGQPFHAGHPDRAVADHIPALFDALIGLLNATPATWIAAQAPLENIGILAAAQSHSRERAAQGLKPADVVVEFRLLRQEIWRAVRATMTHRAPTADVMGAEMLVNDALDGAITLGLIALSDQVEQVREEFLATTLHDVRQPLTAISGDAQLLVRHMRRDVPDVARVMAIGERMQAAVARMLAMLETLAEMSKVALGSLDLHRTGVDLADVVDAALAQYALEDRARVGLARSAGADLTGQWDPQRLQQVVSNLLGNALKYSPPATPVELTLRADPVEVTLQVRDHGIGIPAEEIPHIFARYRRASNALAQGAEGSGLGLYLCLGIVEAHAGRIWAESGGAGQGTTVTVVLPRQPSRPASA
jgi:signal transduction histidine kinase